MDIISEAKKFRAFIEEMALNIDDETAKDHIDVFPLWKANVEYEKDFRVRYNDTLFKVLQDHVSQADWTPDIAVSLYVSVSDPQEEFPEWVQPTGAHDAYNKGDKVSHNEKHWISLVDANVWEPTEENPTLWELQSVEPVEPVEPIEPVDPDWEIADFVQPTAESPYMKGDKVRFNDEIYESLIDNNIWSPAEYPQGWQLL